MNDNEVYIAKWLTSGATITALDSNPEKDGYTFAGWKDASGNSLPSTMTASDLTVYAQYTEDEVPVDQYFGVGMGSNDYRTFVYSDYAIDFSKAVGLEGYYAKSVNSAGTEVVFEQVTGIVAANTPLLLKKTATETKLWWVDAAGTTPSPNLLVAGDGSEIHDEGKYVLTYHLNANNEYEYVFAETTYEKAIVESDRAYLNLSSSGARGQVTIRFVKANDTLGISDIETETTGQKVIYDLRGQRVDRPTKGIYIINGRKVVIK